VRGVSTGQERLNLDEKTLADAFKAAGYATGAFGKWHNGSQWPYHPNARGFDEYYGFTSGHWGEYFDPPLERNGVPVRGKGYIADDLTDHALAFIDRNKDRPFFCYVPYNTPHSPWAAPADDWKRFKDRPLSLRAKATDPEKLDETRCALAMCESMDRNIGRILQRLEELKLGEDTIVLFFCDNGPNTFRWNGGMKGRKGSTDEGGVRSPLFIRWTGKLTPGRTIKEIAGAIDLMPTLTALAGIPHAGDKPLDGRDLSQLLRSSTEVPWPKRILFSHQNGNVSARTQQHRLDQKGGLFDMLSDPGQERDVASEHPEIAATLTEAVTAWKKDIFNLKDNDAVKNRLRPSVDRRPFPVGYPEFPRTPLPARDGTPHGEIRRSASAPNCSYFVNWTRVEDSITWDIEVATTGTYAVDIQYTCPESDAGSTVQISFGSSKLEGKVTPGWDPPLYSNQDTIPRPAAESRMKEFRPLHLGTIKLEKGRDTLTLQALHIPGKHVMDVRAVVLTLQR
jgi:hypothetical protein